MKRALKEMHELVVATLVESIATLPKAQRTKLALALKNKANIIHVESGGHYVEGEMKTLRGSPIGLKVAALRDAAAKIEGTP